MKPHRLAFCALGPYPGEVEIDFDKLSTDGLFLIWGRTGAGKTFLLDALCFALFGEVPGERPYDTLPSDHASPAVSPWVELEFTAQGDRWLIHRVPAHKRAKKRGSGTTEEKASAALERLVSDTRHPVAQKIRDVDQKIVELLGLTASQFQQVVMLPQGKFEEVLRSSSDEREKLLITLFGTSIYESAATWLEAEAKQRKGAAADLEDELGVLRNKAAERWREVAPPDECDGTPDDSHDGSHEVPADWPDADEPGDTPWPADQTQFDHLVERAQSAAADAAAAALAADARRRSADDDQSNAALLAGRWDQRDRLMQDLSRLVNAEASINAKREALRLADAAEALRRVLDDEKKRREELNQCAGRTSEHYATLRKKLAGAMSLPDDVAIPPPDDPALQSSLTHIGTQIARHFDKLSDFVDDASMASQQESDAAAARESAASYLELQRQSDRTAKEHDSEKDEVEAKLNEAKSAADRLSGLTDAAASACERAEAAAGLRALMPEHSSATETLRSTSETTIERRTEELDLRHRYLEGIAAVLAGELVDGSPCPVCGSAEHPSPAEPADDAVSAEGLEAAGAAIESAAKAEKRAREKLQRINSQIDELRGRAGDAADVPEAAATQADAAAEELAAASELAGKQEALQDALEEHQGKAQSARQESSEAATDARLALAAAKNAEDEAEKLRSEIRQEIGEIDLNEALVGLRAVESSLGELHQQIRKHANARTALDALAGTLATQIQASPFAAADEARSALLASAERDTLRDEVASHDEAIHDTRRDLKADELQCLPDVRPDTSATREAAKAATTVAADASKHHTLIANASDAISGWSHEHRNRGAEHTDALIDAELWSAVADRCSGRLPPKVSLQRWVLSAYLEQICERANKRLGEMTGGRYQLGVYRDQERRGAKGGLGLRVQDAYTGAEREVSTLSGGETFQASLALALGVADVVTARTGGVRLEILFVDEGFGTLDSETLQLAMDELDRLREGGRAVGLISHVAELRERIRTGIEVRPADNGSEIRRCGQMIGA